MTGLATTRPHWVFDDSPIADPLGFGERAVKFFGALHHPLSVAPSGRFGLPRFWERIIRRIYGPRHPDGRRIVRTVFCMIPRGARKTATIGGGLGLLHSVGHEKVPTGQVFLGAGAEDQAALAFDEAVGMVRATPALRKTVKVRADYIEHPRVGSTLQVLSAEGDVSHGSTPAAVFLDELHIFKNRKLWKALKTGMIKSPGTLLCITTTAGRGQEGLAWEEYQYAKRIASGAIENETYLPIIFEPHTGSDWRDERLWHFVNPGLSEGFPVLEEMRAAAREAVEKPSERDDFKQYNLNFWLENSTSPFVEMSIFDVGRSEIQESEINGRPCWIAVDCSTTTDLTGVLAAFPDEDGFIIKCWGFVPGDNLQARAERDGVPYPRWAEEGWIIPTPGNVIDYRTVEAFIRELAGKFDVREIDFDPAYAQQIMGPLTDDGFPTATMRQGWVTQSPALNLLERAIIARKLKWDSPVLRWCMENVAIYTDSAGNRTMHKGKSRDRIDLAVCLWMAVSRASRTEPKSLFGSESFDAEKFIVSI